MLLKYDFLFLKTFFISEFTSNVKRKLYAVLQNILYCIATYIFSNKVSLYISKFFLYYVAKVLGDAIFTKAT